MGGKAGAKKRVSKTKEIPQEDVHTENYTVEKIVGDRIIKGKTQYKVHWAGYSTDEETWENESQLDCNEILEEYLAEIAENNDADGKGKEESNAKPARSGRGQDGLKSSRKDEDEDLSEPETGAAADDTSSKYSSPKKGRAGQEKGGKPKKFKKDEGAQDDAGGESNSAAASGEYVVERIVDSRKMNGKTQYLIHWQGYTTDEETWENLSQLDCEELIDEYLTKNTAANENVPENEKKSAKKRPAGKKKLESNPEKKKAIQKPPGPVNGSQEYEVERIIDMHTLKSGKREFLIRWKGFRKGDDTWEPESHLEGTDILAKFLEKVEKAKELPVKELRMNRRPTDRFTTMPQGDKRRQSKRHANHQRVKYYDAE